MAPQVSILGRTGRADPPGGPGGRAGGHIELFINPQNTTNIAIKPYGLGPALGPEVLVLGPWGPPLPGILMFSKISQIWFPSFPQIEENIIPN